MQWDCGRLGFSKGETLSLSGNITDVSLWCAPSTKVFFFSFPTSCSLSRRESANLLVQFGMVDKNAKLLNVLAEAKNGDICQYNLVYLEKSASLLVRYNVTNL